MICSKCKEDKELSEFYTNDKSCKECRKAMVRANRKKNIKYYREYDKKRANRPDRVQARKNYAKTPEGMEASNRAKVKWSKSNAKKRWCSNAVNNAVRDGLLIKPNQCSKCGSNNRIEGHHNDYDNPLDVTWLCSKCHRAWHKENGDGKNAS